MKKYLIFMFLVILVISGCTQNKKVNNKAEETNNVMKVSFKTSDNVNIVGNFYDAKSDKNVILLHMFSRNKESWQDFPKELQRNGFNVLAIDLRGHGESDLDYNKFSDKDFDDIEKDVQAASDFMSSKNNGKLYIIGASIGANTALNYAYTHDLYKIVLLSPGLNFKGIKTDASGLIINVLFVVSKDDAYSLESVNKLSSQLQGKSSKEIKIYEKAGHGTNMFVEKDLSSFIIEWLKE